MKSSTSYELLGVDPATLKEVETACFKGTHSAIVRVQIKEDQTPNNTAREMSYSPYSKFSVGCAILTSSNGIYLGANVENASFGAGICAERVAVTKAVTEGHKEFKMIAISSYADDPITPCGICRQVLYEFAPSLPLYLLNKDGTQFHVKVLSDLLPMGFGPNNLSS